MRALITGIAGFAGSHLAELALGEGAAVVGTVFPGSSEDNLTGIRGKVETVPCDLTEPGAAARVLREIRPDRVFHLAGVSVVGTSWQRRAEVLRANLDGTFQLFEGLRAHPVPCLLFSSAEALGLISDVIAFRSSYVAEHPREVAAFLRGWFNFIDELGHGVAQRQEALAVVAIASGVSLQDVEREFLGIKLLDFPDNAVAFTYGDDITSLYGSGARLLDFLTAAGQLREPVELTAVLDPRFIRQGLRDER